jgi:hypothetical protein
MCGGHKRVLIRQDRRCRERILDGICLVVLGTVSFPVCVEAQTIAMVHANWHSRSGIVLDLTLTGEDASDQISVLIDSTEVYHKAGSVSSHERPHFPLKAIAAGPHTLTVRLLDSGGALRVATTPETWTKQAPGADSVTIDEYNNIQVNGQGFFPITPFLVEACPAGDGDLCLGNWLGAINANGYLSAYSDAGYSVSQYASSLATEAAIWGPGFRMLGPDGGRFGPTEDTTAIAEYASSLRDSPYILGWTWADEPDLYDLTAATMTSFADATRSNDPNHPVWLNLYGYNPTVQEGKGYLAPDVADVFGFDVYPVGTQIGNINSGWDQSTMTGLAGFMDEFQSLSHYLQPWMPITEAAEDHGVGAGPSPQQVYLEKWLVIIHGAKGLGYWQPWGETSPETLAILRQLLGTVNTMMPALTGVPTAHTVTSNQTATNSRVDAASWEDANAVYVAAVRPDDFFLFPNDEGGITISIDVRAWNGNDPQVIITRASGAWSANVVENSWVRFAGTGLANGAPATCFAHSGDYTRPCHNTRYVRVRQVLNGTTLIVEDPCDMNELSWIPYTECLVATNHVAPNMTSQTGVAGVTLNGKDFSRAASSATLSAQLTVAGIADATANVLNESRTVAVSSGGVIADAFAPWDVHIYQIPKTSPAAPRGLAVH